MLDTVRDRLADVGLTTQDLVVGAIGIVVLYIIIRLARYAYKLLPHRVHSNMPLQKPRKQDTSKLKPPKTEAPKTKSAMSKPLETIQRTIEKAGIEIVDEDDPKQEPSGQVIKPGDEEDPVEATEADIETFTYSAVDEDGEGNTVKPTPPPSSVARPSEHAVGEVIQPDADDKN